MTPLSTGNQNNMNRRELLRAAAALSVYGLPSAALLRVDGAAAATAAEPFDYAMLKGRARALAAQAYVEPRNDLPESLDRISWDDYQKLSFVRKEGLWYGKDLPFRIEMFHPGLFFKHPVQIYEVADGKARHIDYDPRQFQAKGLKLGRLSKDLGYAGFRIHHDSDWERDIAAFLGASYFRAVSASRQYGLSARGLAIDTGLPRPEEFPRFSVFWIERPQPDATELVVYALLDSPSVTGAYRFGIRPGETLVMNVDAALYPRKTIERLGIAPLTSMYQTGENDRRYAYDFRPEIHDSDGLALWTGAGEWIWRPLVNPRDVRVNSFFDDNPQGFGLLQRDRDFDHYLDGVHYERRASLWIEPVGDWGEGSVQLIEIPTDDEIHDNIVAMWVPKAPARAGSEYRLKYRLHWSADEPYPTSLARCVATRLGNGGEPGKPRPQGVRKFVVEFLGGPLASLPFGVRPEAVLSASRGRFSYVFCEAVPNGVAGHWRAQFDLTTDGDAPVDLRLYLRNGSETLSETWLYQYHPFAPSRSHG